MRGYRRTLSPFEMMDFLGDCYGSNAWAFFRQQTTELLLNRVGTQKLILRLAIHDYENCQTHTRREEITTKEMIENLLNWKWFENSDVDKIKTFDDLKRYYIDYSSEGDCSIISLLTKEDDERQEAENKRKKLESYAAQFASENGVTVGTMDFVRAVENSLNDIANESESWNNAERRMEEWAAHRYSGGGSETYFDDLNYVNDQIGSRYDLLCEVMVWLRANCPLLMAKYEEAKLEAALQE